MGLFHFGKKKEEITKDCCKETQSGGCRIKVLGTGCKSCHEMFENAKKAVNSMGLSAQVEHVTDLQEVMKYGVMSTPALVVNEKVVSAGKVLKEAEVEKILRDLSF